MRRLLLSCFASIAFCVCARADENIAKAQTRLQAEGFYRGNPTGNYDKETAAAVTRYQIRHGLAITGNLDAATSRELGITASAAEAPPQVLTGTWRRLRSGEMQFVSKPSASPPPTAKGVAQPNSAPSSSPPGTAEEQLAEAMRNYVAAFILAGLDPRIGSELEFFAPRVDYFGARNVPREQIRRDLVRYDRRWPERRFSLDGDIRVRRRTATSVDFDFPLRYELRNGTKQASGKVTKNLLLAAGGDNEMQIVAVNESKAE